MTPEEINYVLERFDQTDFVIQRGIVVAFIERAEAAEKQLAEAKGLIQRLVDALGWVGVPMKNAIAKEAGAFLAADGKVVGT